MRMLSLSHYFEKFKNIERSNTETIRQFIEIVHFSCGFNLSFDEVTVERNIALLNTSPVKRTEIFMHKESIKEELVRMNSKVVDFR